MQDINLGVDEVPIILPEALCIQAAMTNYFSIVGVILNPKKQNLNDLIEEMPRLRGLRDGVFGRIIDSNKFQFLFQTEESMNHVLTGGPWSYNDWMLVVQRWTPNITKEELKIIPFWIQIRGIPLQYLTSSMVKYIGEILGYGQNVAVDESTNRVDFVKVRVYWNIDNPLHFKRQFQFAHNENTILSFRYEELRNFCVNCGMLTHEASDCPLHYGNVFLAAGPSNDSSAVGGKSPSLVEDKDLTAETWRYMQAKITKGKFKEADFLNLMFDYITEEEIKICDIKDMNNTNEGLFGSVYSDMSQGFDYNKESEKEERNQMITRAKGKFREDELMDVFNGYVNNEDSSSFNKEKRNSVHMM